MSAYPPEPSAEWREPDYLPRGVTVQRGEVIVNHVWRVLWRPGVRVYQCDLRTKYADAAIYAFVEPGHVDVLLLPTPESLHLARDAEGPTTVRLRTGRGEWSVMVEGARYTLTICLWRGKP